MTGFTRRIRVLKCERCQTVFELVDRALPSDKGFARLNEWLSEHDKHVEQLRVSLRELHTGEPASAARSG